MASLHISDQVWVAATWSKDGIEYTSNSWDSRISTTPIVRMSNMLYSTSLNFLPLEERDSGNYECTAVLTSFAGVPLANGTNNTSLVVRGETQYIK